MATIKFLDAEAQLNNLIRDVHHADSQVSSALTKFQNQVNILITIDSESSDESQMIKDIIETANLESNLNNPVWLDLKAKAELAKSEIADRLASYKLALPTVKALRSN